MAHMPAFLAEDGNPMDKLALFVKTRTQPGQRDQLRAMFQKHLAPRAEANRAQEVVIWCDDEHDLNVFYLFEVYSDRKAFEENSQAASQAGWFAEYMKEAMPLLAGQPEVIFATPRWAKRT